LYRIAYSFIIELVAPIILTPDDVTIVEGRPFVSPMPVLAQGDPAPTWTFGFSPPGSITIYILLL
jgi:hypothetical protein